MYGVAQLLLGKVIMGLQATGVSTGISTGGIIAEPRLPRPDAVTPPRHSCKPATTTCGDSDLPSGDSNLQKMEQKNNHADSPLLNKMREDYPDFAKIVEDLDMRLT